MPKILCLIIYNETEYYDKMKKKNEEYLLFLNTTTEIMKDTTVIYVTYKNLSGDGIEYLLNDNVLYIHGDETYIPGILNKTIHSLEILTYKLNIEYDFILRTNASTVINFQKVINYINGLNINANTNYYIGPYNYLTWYDHENGIIDNRYHGTRFCGGAFILLNKELMINIMHNKDKIISTIIDDVSIGQYINTVSNTTEICIKDKILFNYDCNIQHSTKYLAYFNNTNKNNRNIDVDNFKIQIDNIINDTNKQYSIVLPINPDTDINQCIINIKLLYKYAYLPDIHKIYIISSFELIEKMNERISTYNKIQFINEDQIYPKIPGKNWLYQQILKLKISKYIKTLYYLILDADMYLIKPLNLEDMFHENKIIYAHECFPHNNPPGYTNKKWWEGSCALMEYDIERLHNKNNLMGVTPQLLITDIVNNLLIFLTNKYGLHWENILINNGFTEYSLYWIYIIQTNNEILYTQFGNPLLDVDEENSVLHPSSNETIIHTINNMLTCKKYHFLLIQGWLGIDIDIYSDKLLSLI